VGAAPEQLLATVRRSPAAVAVHDKAAWVGLFAPDGLINDPVGSRPHVGPDAIARFYDMFIAPNTIEFEVARDLVCGTTVMRDLTVHTTMGPGVELHIPMHLRYELVPVPGGWKIAGLYAHWELAAMIGQLLRCGGRGLLVGAQLGPRMLRTLGVRGTVGFADGLRGVGAGGKRRAAALAVADGYPVGKVIAAGREVTVSVSAPRPGVLRYVFPTGDGDPTLTRYLC
jgi:hypothetical protein